MKSLQNHRNLSPLSNVKNKWHAGNGGGSPKIRIAIADNQPIFRDSLRRLLSREPDFEIVAEAVPGDEIFDAIETHDPDILLADLIEFGGLSHLHRLHSQGVRTKVIILTASEDTRSHVLAMRYGAHGVVVKTCATEFLVEGIRNVHNGQLCLNAKTMALLMCQLSSPRRPGSELSHREEEVLALVCRAFRNKQIAERLGLSEDTVKTYLRRIFEKTGASNRMELLHYAFESGVPIMANSEPTEGLRPLRTS